MWIAAKVLHTSPFDNQIANLTQPQIAWILANYYKDEEDDLEKTKLLCRFLNPEAAHKLFDQTEEEVTMVDEDFLEEIKEHTSEEINLQTLKKSTQQRDLDTIEVVEE